MDEKQINLLISKSEQIETFIREWFRTSPEKAKVVLNDRIKEITERAIEQNDHEALVLIGLAGLKFSEYRLRQLRDDL